MEFVGGGMLPRFFNAGVAVANNAESGESLRSSLHANRLAKVLIAMKSGDYLFIQYGHNDMKEKGNGIGAFTTYKTDLKHFADTAKEKGATVFSSPRWSVERASNTTRSAIIRPPFAGEWPKRNISR